MRRARWQGLPPNRAIYGEPEQVEMTFAEMREPLFVERKEGKEHLSGYIVFTSDSFLISPYDEAVENLRRQLRQ